MFHKHFIILSIILFCFYKIKCEIIEKEKVLAIEDQKYESRLETACNSDNYGFCGVHYYCKENTCTNSTYSATSVQFPNSEGKMETYVTEVCNPRIVEGACNSNNCKKDNDCLSNKCVNNTCIVNEASPVISCALNYNYNYFTFSEKMKIHCGKASNENCSEDSECAYGECSKYEKTCIYQYHDHVYYSLTPYIYLFLGGLLLIIILFSWCCYKASGFISNKSRNKGKNSSKNKGNNIV
eukprot:jgi/Orpsp1_1/1187750/evm.model.d7180000059915.1